MQTYLFYDIETTGLNKSFDQVLHFAAIRTTLELKELNRYEVKVKLNPDLIPAPGAMITHQMTLAEAESGTSELNAIQQIHEWMNTPGTISLGYNTLGFDDEFLRFSFYRNLLPPYTHQYANQCGRMDLYPMTVMYYLFKRDILNWPKINGETRLKLELLNQENHFVQGRSHHAMVDVEVTLALAQRYYQEQDMWQYLTAYFDKAKDQARSTQLPLAYKQAESYLRESLIVDSAIGNKQNFIAPTVHLGEPKHYRNQTLWLRLDTQDFAQIKPETIAETTWIIRKKWGEPNFTLPPHERYLKHVIPERLRLAESNKQWLNQNPEMLKLIIQYHREYQYPKVPDVDAESALYLNGFWSNEEMALCRRFHQVNPDEKAALIQRMQNPILKTLALRLLGRHYPQALSAEQNQEYKRYLHSMSENSQTKIIDFKGHPRLNAQTALEEIKQLRKTELNSLQKELLSELEKYLQKTFL